MDPGTSEPSDNWAVTIGEWRNEDATASELVFVYTRVKYRTSTVIL